MDTRAAHFDTMVVAEVMRKQKKLSTTNERDPQPNGVALVVSHYVKVK